MFTGIVEEIGIVKEFRKDGNNGGNSASLIVKCNKILDDIKLGDSISINGVCQTVVAFDRQSFSVQISSTTLGVTNFSSLKTGQEVNLERALTLNSRLGGHVVSGHIDGIAKLKNIQKLGDFYNIKFEIAQELEQYFVKKGSVSINGISLTVAGLVGSEFEIAVIPHTFENTNLKSLKSGDLVNIEVDILAKYVEKFLSTSNNNTEKTKVSEDFLKEHGFL